VEVTPTRIILTLEGVFRDPEDIRQELVQAAYDVGQISSSDEIWISTTMEEVE
jgi:hypothetical protein